MAHYFSLIILIVRKNISRVDCFFLKDILLTKNFFNTIILLVTKKTNNRVVL